MYFYDRGLGEVIYLQNDSAMIMRYISSCVIFASYFGARYIEHWSPSSILCNSNRARAHPWRLHDSYSIEANRPCRPQTIVEAAEKRASVMPILDASGKWATAIKARSELLTAVARGRLKPPLRVRP